MQTIHPNSRSASNRSSSVHFMHMKMFIKSGSPLPVTASIADVRQRRLEGGTQMRSWDDDGGAQPAQPQERAKE